MIRHARAAALAAAVLCVPASAAAEGGDWWLLDSATDGNGSMTVLIDAASSRSVDPGVVELRLLTELVTAGAPMGWIDARVRFDCAHGRSQVARTIVYDAELKVVREDAGFSWAIMPPDEKAPLFVCNRERDRFHKREGFTAPMG